MDELFEEFMAYELTQDTLTCEICGDEFEDDDEQIGEQRLGGYHI